jgi:hypothetical protein
VAAHCGMFEIILLQALLACLVSVTRCGMYHLLSRVDHGEPLGLLHECAYIPIDSWRGSRGSRGSRGQGPEPSGLSCLRTLSSSRLNPFCFT